MLAFPFTLALTLHNRTTTSKPLFTCNSNIMSFLIKGVLIGYWFGDLWHFFPWSVLPAGQNLQSYVFCKRNFPAMISFALHVDDVFVIRRVSGPLPNIFK